MTRDEQLEWVIAAFYPGVSLSYRDYDRGIEVHMNGRFLGMGDGEFQEWSHNIYNAKTTLAIMHDIGMGRHTLEIMEENGNLYICIAGFRTCVRDLRPAKSGELANQALVAHCLRQARWEKI